jgi:WhiB family redox-sensing transcriptional regulator
MAALDWQANGACRDGDQAVFFAPDVPGEPRAERLRRLLAAKRVCAACPVRELCRTYALENEEEFGVWGGLSELERKQLITERRS